MPEEPEARRGRAGRVAGCPERRDDASRTCRLAGRRVVLGVTGGIAAYKAVEVCRRLVDAGAHVAPVLTEGATALRRRGHLLGPGLRARPDLALGRGRPHPAHPPRPGRRPGRRLPGHRPAARRLRRRHLRRPAHRHAAGHPGAGRGLPGHAHRDVGAPGGAGQPPGPRRAGRHDRARPRRAAWPAATSAPAAWPTPSVIVAALEAVLGPDDLAGLDVLVTAGGTREPIDPVRFIGNRSSGKQGHALADEAAARGAKVTLVTTVDRPAAAGRRGGPGGDRGRDGGRRAAAQRRGRRRRHGRRGGRLPPGRRRRQQDQEGRAGPRGHASSRPPTSSPGSRRPQAPGQILVGFAAETDDVEANAAAKLARKGVDLIVANDVSAPGAGFESRHQRGA